ncbi:MAG: 3-phenylpropionate/cinnamic acid dioxygenase subunit beta [Gammaproteobacteria bacterium]|nr:3-phenylpropionate/cinnamic acid dioxygenase subunit beta [Gammaproteobacteria bacterium]
MPYIDQAAPGHAAFATPAELQHEVEQFLYAEATLLDAREYRQWFELLADDLRYRMPLRFNRAQRERRSELSEDHHSFLFDETKASMDMRIRRLETGMAWAEEPPSRTRHLITNVRAMVTDSNTEVRAESYFHIYRSRLERQVDQLVGVRYDRLRRSGEAMRFHIVERYIVLDQSTVLANNLSMFF